MSLNKQKEKIQQESYEAWLANGKIGTIEQATGTGKTFVAFKCILSMPKGSNILFLAETVVRENTVLKDALEYKKFYGINPLDGYKFKFATYQGAYKYNLWDYFPKAKVDNTIVVMDEIHDICSDKRIEFIKNSDSHHYGTFTLYAKVGLSATIDKKTLYQIQGQETTKFDLLKTFCPVVYTYSLQDSMDNKTTRELRFFVLNHELDPVTKNIESGAVGNKFMATEKSKYPYLDKAVRDAMFRKYSDAKTKKDTIMRIANIRARFLYSLPSKVKLCKSLLPHLKGRTLVFGKDSDCLLQICPTSIVADNPNYIQDLDDFKSGKTNIASANRILKQGENVPLLGNVIITAYYSKPTDFQQIIGRCRTDMPEGNIIIFKTQGTQEEKWFESMIEGLNVSFIYCSNLKQLLDKL